jgi:hypothetical protein
MISILLDRIYNGVVEETIDLTRKLDDQSKLTIRNELERDAFELVVPDVELKLSDLDESLYNMFFTAPLDTAWKLHIFNNGVAKFRGFLNNDFITRDMNEEYIILQSYSTMKRFWELAKETKLGKSDNASQEYYNPIYDGFSEDIPGYHFFINFFNRYYLNQYFTNNFILLGTDFSSNILIRSSYYCLPNSTESYLSATIVRKEPPDYNAVINRVLFANLTGTLKDLLIAIAKNNNSEWYIDIETEILKLRPRNAIINDLDEDLSDKVIDSDAVDVKFSDEKKYDYVSIFAPLSSENIPRLDYVEDGGQVQIMSFLRQAGRPLGYYEYILASVDSKGMVISCGNILKVTAYAGRMTEIRPIISGGNIYFLAIPHFTIPALVGLPNVASRRIYRRCVGGISSLSPVAINPSDYDIGKVYGGLGVDFYNGNFFLVGVFGGNLPIVFIDAESDFDFIQRLPPATAQEVFVLPPTAPAGVKLWMRYDEVSSLWKDAIQDIGTNTPTGAIFDSTPSLDFNGSQATSEETYHFFGGNADYTKQQERWKDMMLTKRKVSLSMSGNDLNLGDAFTLRKITKLKGINNVVVKTATEDLIKEETQLELITV